MYLKKMETTFSAVTVLSVVLRKRVYVKKPFEIRSTRYTRTSDMN